ncbi:gene transfer agent family protein [Methylocystis parvus]|uniref:gene transfer agent family protein n=1 Tax=Methylocystis parvus TaxID=134 RepID=UPI003C72072C
MTDKQTCVYAQFAGRRQKFELRLGELGELERLCRAGVALIFGRLVSETWFYDDVRETIRLGLMGGGASEVDADMLIERYVDAGPKRIHVALAASIISAFIDGVDVPKGEGEKEASAPPATSPPSMKPAGPSDSAREPSTE